MLNVWHCFQQRHNFLPQQCLSLPFSTFYTLNKKPKDFADNLERANADEGGPSSCVHSELIYGLGLDQDKKAFHSSILTELMSDIFQIRIWNPFPDP